MKYCITTLGCKVNQYESQAIDTLLRARGHIPCPEGEAAVHIVNTCAVTAESARKSRQAIRSAKRAFPDAVVAVCGCFSQLSPWDVLELDADLVYGSGERLRFVDDLELIAAKRGDGLAPRSHVSYIADPRERREFERLPSGSLEGRTRAMLKIEDGCDNRCTYCVVPIARGGVRSLPLDEAAAEAARLAEQGFRELVLTGIEITSYGRDLPGSPGLADLAEAVSSAAPSLRLRLGSLDPGSITPEFVRRLRDTGALCPHFHLSMQSGCDEILWKMGRRYTTRRFAEAVSALREQFPSCGLTADLIVGFPGETEGQHEETLAFIRGIGFSSMHIFPYSPRPGTPAADMDGIHDRSTLRRRARETHELGEIMRSDYLLSRVGETLSVLFETEEGGNSSGHAGNYCLVAAPGSGLRGSVRNVKITAVRGNTLVGDISDSC